MAAVSQKPRQTGEDHSSRRGEILDAAFNEFAARGYAGASMETIARQAHASKETLYSWFGNKEKLFNTLLQARIDGFTSRYQSGGLGPDSSPEMVLQTIAEDVMRFMLAVEPLSRALGTADEPVARARHAAGRLIAEERKKFAALVKGWRTKGFIAFDDDPLEVVSLFVAMAQGEWSFRLATGMIDDLTDRMIEAHARRVTRIFLKGLAPQKKRR